MKARIRIYPFLIVLVAVLTVFIVSSMAQEKPADNMQIVREKIQTDKKLFIAENMNLTESEAKVFWPVYENYQKDLGKLVDKTVKLNSEKVCLKRKWHAITNSKTRSML
jgi:hypothetical protein